MLTDLEFDTKYDVTQTIDDECDLIGHPPRNIWTLIDTDGVLYICAGIHHVNRIHYLITDTPWAIESEEYKVK